MRSRKSLKTSLLCALAVLNLVLLASFVMKMTGENTAHAQAARRPGDYIMIPVQVLGQSQGIIAVLDMTNGELGAMAYDDANRELGAMPPIDLNQVLSAGQGAGNNTERRR